MAECSQLYDSSETTNNKFFVWRSIKIIVLGHYTMVNVNELSLWSEKMQSIEP